MSAHLQLAADETSSVATRLTIAGEASNDAVAFEKDEGNLSSCETTHRAVGWEPPAWTMGDSGPDQRTPELRSLVQEIVDRPGWQAGKAMVFLISGTGHRTAHAHYGSVERAPRLELGTSPRPPRPVSKLAGQHGACTGALLDALIDAGG